MELASLSPKMVGVQVQQGRFLTDHDLMTAAAVAIIDSVTAAKLFPDQNPLGSDVRIANKNFTVIGVFTLARASGDERNTGQVFVAFTTLRRLFGDTVVKVVAGELRAEAIELTEILLSVEVSDTASTRVVVENILRKYHTRRDYSVQIQ